MTEAQIETVENTSLVQAGYLPAKGDQIYYVLHQSPNPVAQIVLVGPFPSERIHASIPWTRWARFLAKSRISAVRFDYRGSGESTGEFGQQTIDSWLEDIHTLIGFLRRGHPGLPLVLHGLDFGGLLAANAFPQSTADALLLWSPAPSGPQALRSALLRRLAADIEVAGASVKKKSWQDHVSDLETTGFIQVEGYSWSKALWDQAQTCRLTLPDSQLEKRPWKSVTLDKSAAPLISGFGQWRSLDPWAYLEPLPLNPDLSTLFSANVEWIYQAITPTRSEHHEKVHSVQN